MAASGGLVALPAWANAWSTRDLVKTRPVFLAAEEVTLSSVADTIIPAGDSVGALSVGVDKFLVRLFADCYEDDVQVNIKEQLGRLDNIAREQHAKSFVDCNQLQREQILSPLATSEKKEEKDFYELVKGETIRGFRTSKEVMLNYLDYRLVPGHYTGCIDIKN